MKLSEMTPEQRREYNRNAKRRERAEAKAQRMRTTIPDAFDYVMPEQQLEKLTEYCLGLKKAIAAELEQEKLTAQAEYVVDLTASVLFGFDHGITQVVHDPDGVLVGGHFPDAVASVGIEHIHRTPNLLRSATFGHLYSQFLNAVAKWVKENSQYASTEYVQDLNHELAGTYVLPPFAEQPTPEPQASEAPSFPSNAEILERGRIQLLNQLKIQISEV